MPLTMPPFIEQSFCKSREFCHRCRNEPAVRHAIFSEFGITPIGTGCPLGLRWDTPPNQLPVESRWDAPGSFEYTLRTLMASIHKGTSPGLHCKLRELTACGCKGGSWVVCHYPGFYSSGIKDINEYTPKYVSISPLARGEIPADMVARLADPAVVERAKFRAALETACRAHGGAVPEHKEDCDICWANGAQGTRQGAEECKSSKPSQPPSTPPASP